MGFKCSIELRVKTVTCPGVSMTKLDCWKRRLSLQVILFNKLKSTSSRFPQFPCHFYNTLTFKKNISYCSTVRQLASKLAGDIMYMELWLANSDKNGVVLATGFANVLEFFFDNATTPASAEIFEKFLLLQKTAALPSVLSPKIQLSATVFVEYVPLDADVQLKTDKPEVPKGLHRFHVAKHQVLSEKRRHNKRLCTENDNILHAIEDDNNHASILAKTNFKRSAGASSRITKVTFEKTSTQRMYSVSIVDDASDKNPISDDDNDDDNSLTVYKNLPDVINDPI